MKGTREQAFTLIELLATVAIIATLAALVSAVTLSGRDGANVAKSISNLRQIATAMQVFANENAERFPIGYYYNNQPPEITYVTQLAPYLDEQPSPLRPSRNIFVAPTSAIPVPVKSASSTIPMTYSVNALLSPNTTSGAVGLLRTQVRRPSKVIMVGDGVQNPSSANSQTTFTSPTAFKTLGSAQALDSLIPVGSNTDVAADVGQLRYRSRDAAAVAMVDGHVELLKKGTVTYGNVIADR